MEPDIIIKLSHILHIHMCCACVQLAVTFVLEHPIARRSQTSELQNTKHGEARFTEK
jgi:hypothetical protein